MSGGDALLLVEDDPNDVFFFEAALGKLGTPIPLARVADGAAAVAWLDAWARRHAPEAERPALLVVLDLKIPLRSGLDVLAWMRADAVLRDVPVVVFTSSGEPGDITRARALGVDAYHVKPASFVGYSDLVKQFGRRFLALARVPAAADR